MKVMPPALPLLHHLRHELLVRRFPVSDVRHQLGYVFKRSANRHPRLMQLTQWWVLYSSTRPLNRTATGTR